MSLLSLDVAGNSIHEPTCRYPWASSEESEQKVNKLLKIQSQSCFTFLFKEHNLFSLEDKNQYLSLLEAPSKLYGWRMCGEIEANANSTFPHFKSVKAAEGSWGNKGPLSLGLPVGIFSFFPYVMGYLIWRDAGPICLDDTSPPVMSGVSAESVLYCSNKQLPAVSGLQQQRLISHWYCMSFKVCRNCALCHLPSSARLREQPQSGHCQFHVWGKTE